MNVRSFVVASVILKSRYMVKQLKVGSRKIWMHKGIIDPDFSTEHVLSRDPWLYVELWLRRQNSAASLAYWAQARRFADASKTLSVEAAPLTIYYAFLNATKALLTHKSCGMGSSHGVSGSRPEDARASLKNEIVNFRSGGVLPDLCVYLGEPSGRESYSLKEIFWNIPFIHRAFLLTFTSAPELFIPLESARYVQKPSCDEACRRLEERLLIQRNRQLVPRNYQYLLSGHK